MVAGEIQLLEHRRDFKLRRSRLVVAGLGRNPQPPQRLVHLGHKRQHPRLDRAVVVVVELLVFRRRRAEQRAPGLDQVGTAGVEPPVHQKILLLGPERDLRRTAVFDAEHLQQPFDLFRQRLDRTQQRRLFVQRLAGVTAERGRDAERRAEFILLDESRAGRIPCGIAARLESRTQPARRETRRVGFAHHQILARKFQNRPFAFRLQKRVVLFGGSAGQRLEPVGVMGRALRDRPLLHRVGDVPGDRGVQRRAFPDGFQQLLIDRARQELLHGRQIEHILAVALLGPLRRLEIHPARFGVGCNVPDRPTSGFAAHIRLFTPVYSKIAHLINIQP